MKRVDLPTVVLALILALFFGMTPAPKATAQVLEIVSTDPEPNAVSVSIQKRLEFRLSKPMPLFGTDFIRKFTRSPQHLARVDGVGHTLDENGDLTIVFWELTHQPDSDFTFIVYGLRARTDNSRMARPITLNYTTASAWGPHRISGTVAFGERLPPATAAPARRELTEALRTLFSDVSVASAPAPKAVRALSGPPGALDPEYVSTPLAAGTREPTLARTVVLLLDSYNLNPFTWTIRSAAVPDEAGAYTFEGIRDGFYYPVAISYANSDGELIGAYGFYDADGDLAPDQIAIQGDATTIENLDLTLFLFEPAPARAYLDLARLQADRFASDQQLVVISDLSVITADPTLTDGTSFEWRYIFHSPSERLMTYVDIDPVNMRVFRPAPSLHGPIGAPIPDSFIDSDRAVEIADAHGGSAFRERYPDAELAVVTNGGDLDRPYRPASGQPFWEVTYRVPDDASGSPLTVFVDMATGEALEGIAVPNEAAPPAALAVALEPAYPNPFRTATALRFSLERPSRIALRVYDLLGREVTTIAEGFYGGGPHTATWRPGSLPDGVYVVRLETPSEVATQRVVRTR